MLTQDKPIYKLRTTYSIGDILKELEITKHELVPRQTLLSDKDKEELLKRYGIVLRQLPRMLASDPLVKLLNCKVGDVVKIIRKSETAGESEYYRVVVKG